MLGDWNYIKMASLQEQSIWQTVMNNLVKPEFSLVNQINTRNKFYQETGGMMPVRNGFIR